MMVILGFLKEHNATKSNEDIYFRANIGVSCGGAPLLILAETRKNDAIALMLKEEPSQANQPEEKSGEKKDESK